MKLNSRIKKWVKKSYAIIPFKKQIFLALRKLYIPKKSVTSHLYFKGVFKVKCEERSFKIMHYGYQVENLIFWHGLEKGFEEDSIKLWMKLCKEANVIFDIGANTGLYSLVAKAINPAAKVYAFDPVRRIADKLRYNISLNNWDIEVIEKAVSNTDGSAIIYDHNIEHVYSATLNENFTFSERGSVETEIETIKLDTFISKHNISGVDLIKLDIETYEPQALEGFSNYLQLFKPSILIEILNDEVAIKVFELVKNLGYLYYNIDERGSIKQQDMITKSEHTNFLFVRPDTAQQLGLVQTTANEIV